MSMLNEIRKDQLHSRKMHDGIRSRLLTTLLSEASNVGLNDGKRESTNEEVVAMIKKFLKGNKETIEALTDKNQPIDEQVAEKIILEGYLPTQLTEQQIEALVRCSFDGEPSMKMMGPIMKSLKEGYEGQYDGKLASEVVKRVLSNK